MQMTRTLAAAVVSAAVVIAGANAVSAQSASTSAGVTVIRGINSGSSQPPTVTRSQGVSVYRSATPTPTVPDTTAEDAPPTLVQSGKNLWFVDPSNGDVSACSLRYDFYGERQIRCTSDRYR